MNYEDQERRLKIFIAADWRCEVCGNDLRNGTPQLAHRIIKSKHNLKKYGPQVIHHRLNLVPVESLKCNAKVNIENKPMQKKRLLAEIYADLQKNQWGGKI